MNIRIVDSYKNQRCNECGLAMTSMPKNPVTSKWQHVELSFNFRQSFVVNLCPKCFLDFVPILKNNANYNEIKMVCVEIAVENGGVRNGK